MQTPLESALSAIPIVPAYRDGRVALFNARCEDILPCIRPSHVITIISDPPYGINWRDPATGQRILGDPYAGSCSTLIAARSSGRYAIGIEADPRHIKAAVDRLKTSCS